MNTRRSFIVAALGACAAWLGLRRKPMPPLNYTERLMTLQQMGDAWQWRSNGEGMSPVFSCQHAALYFKGPFLTDSERAERAGISGLNCTFYHFDQLSNRPASQPHERGG